MLKLEMLQLTSPEANKLWAQLIEFENRQQVRDLIELAINLVDAKTSLGKVTIYGWEHGQDRCLHYYPEGAENRVDLKICYDPDLAEEAAGKISCKPGYNAKHWPEAGGEGPCRIEVWKEMA